MSGELRLESIPDWEQHVQSLEARLWCNQGTERSSRLAPAQSIGKIQQGRQGWSQIVCKPQEGVLGLSLGNGRPVDVVQGGEIKSNHHFGKISGWQMENESGEIRAGSGDPAGGYYHEPEKEK